jgi:NDP-sugar pyrophosphorylase family protein
VYIADDAKIWDGATICAPTVIGHKAEVRPGAFIRGNAIIGDGAVIGNSTEIKNAIVFDGAQLPHYNYVGDSIIGYKGHLGAGAIASNLRLDHKEISIEGVNTGLRKIGVFLGDESEVGCGSVLCPGSVVGKNSAIYPLSTVTGYIPANSVYNGKTVKKKQLRA